MGIKAHDTFTWNGEDPNDIKLVLPKLDQFCLESKRRWTGSPVSPSGMVQHTNRTDQYITGSEVDRMPYSYLAPYDMVN